MTNIYPAAEPTLRSDPTAALDVVGAILAAIMTLGPLAATAIFG